MSKINGKIYQITNTITGDFYIGQTVNSLEDRFNAHKLGTRRNRSQLTKLQLAMEMYGKRNFKIELLQDEIPTINELCQLEREYIAAYSPQYNNSTGGETPLNRGATNPTKSEKCETRIDNRLAHFGFGTLTPVEQNLWWTIVQLITNKGDGELFLDIDDIREISNYSKTNRSKKQLELNMKNMITKIELIDTGFIDEETKKSILFSIFSKFEINENKITLKLKPYFVPWFNDIQTNFTRIDLSILINLKSIYSKELYRFLMRWKTYHRGKLPGFWSIKFIEFKRLMCVPDSYSLSDLERRVLNPAKTELCKINDKGYSPLEKLNIDLIMKKNRKTKLYKIKFSFKEGTAKTKRSKKSVNKKNDMKSSTIPIVKTLNGNFPLNNFMQWLELIKFFDSEYFEIRLSAKKTIEELYSDYVQNSGSTIWTDMRFFAVINYMVKTDKAITSWGLEDTFSYLRKTPQPDLPSTIYKTLPDDKQLQLREFLTEGK